MKAKNEIEQKRSDESKKIGFYHSVEDHRRKKLGLIKKGVLGILQKVEVR